MKTAHVGFVAALALVAGCKTNSASSLREDEEAGEQAPATAAAPAAPAAETPAAPMVVTANAKALELVKAFFGVEPTGGSIHWTGVIDRGMPKPSGKVKTFVKSKIPKDSLLGELVSAPVDKCGLFLDLRTDQAAIALKISQNFGLDEFFVSAYVPGTVETAIKNGNNLDGAATAEITDVKAEGMALSIRTKVTEKVEGKADLVVWTQALDLVKEESGEISAHIQDLNPDNIRRTRGLKGLKCRALTRDDLPTTAEVK